MASMIGLITAFVGFLLLLIAGWTRNANIFGIGVIAGIPAVMYGLRMLLG